MGIGCETASRAILGGRFWAGATPIQGRFKADSGTIRGDPDFLELSSKNPSLVGDPGGAIPGDPPGEPDFLELSSKNPSLGG